MHQQAVLRSDNNSSGGVFAINNDIVSGSGSSSSLESTTDRNAAATTLVAGNTAHTVSDESRATLPSPTTTSASQAHPAARYDSLTSRTTLNVLISAFDPYEGLDHNPVKEVAQSIADLGLQASPEYADLSQYDELDTVDLSIAAVTLPISFAKAWPQLLESIEAIKPHIILAMGVKHAARGVLLERCATNLVDACRPDAEDAQPQMMQVVDGAPAAYWTRLPLRAILKDFMDHNIPASLSSDAGTFVCNSLFYHLLHWSSNRDKVIAGFMSFPPLQGADHDSSRLDRHHLLTAACDVIRQCVAYYQGATAGSVSLA